MIASAVKRLSIVESSIISLMELRPIEVLLADQLNALRWQLALAESCTGGLVCHRLTNMPGSSDYFVGGVVAYSNEVKHRILSVPHETLTQYGAVSEQTVIEMARGAQSLFGVQTAISISGIAGPSGGSPQKPLGTVWIGVALPNQIQAFSYRFHGNRLQIKHQSAEMALWLLADLLGEHNPKSDFRRQIRARQPIAVAFSGEAVETLRLRAIYWREKWIAIESIGRRWQDAYGSHFLAMSYEGKVYELSRNADGCWFIRPPLEHLDSA